MLANNTRPKTLKEVIGQDTIVKAINNGFKTNTLGNVIYLIGPSGVGKNTIANIISEMLICEHPEKDEKGNLIPCCKCASCLDILEEKYQRVKIYSGANLTADSLKDLENELQYNVIFSKHRVIQINEAQQSPVLRRLLEIIEQPYSNTTFILTSTDKSKFSNQTGKSNKEQEIQALRSRGTYLQLKPISIKQIGEVLFNLLSNFDSEDKLPETFLTEVLPLIAENANGNLRLAINDFNTILNAEVYTEKEVIDLLGYENVKEYYYILSELCSKNSSILNRINELEEIYSFYQYSWKVLTEMSVRVIIGKPFDEEWKEKNYRALSKLGFEEVYTLFGEISKEAIGLYNGAFNNYFLYKTILFFKKNNLEGIDKPKKIIKKVVKG